MKSEIWKVYKTSCSGKRVYEVSDQGRVRLNGVIVNFSKYKSSYYSVGSFMVHRAVAELFIPNPENKPCVDHINTNPRDNRAVNLRWCTAKENMNNSLTKHHMSASQKEAQNRAEVKKKKSAAQNRPEVKAKQRAIQKEVQNRPEVKAKQRAIQKEVRQRNEWKEKQHATMIDRKFLTNGIDRKFVRPELFDYYLERGYHFGMK